jgi:hypothetical protein
MEDAEVPLRHHLDELRSRGNSRCTNGGKIYYTGACERRSGKTSVVIH